MQLHQLQEFLEWRALNATIEQPAFFFYYPHVTRLFVVKEIGTLSFEIREDQKGDPGLNMASPRCLHSNPSLTFSILPKADYDKIGMERRKISFLVTKRTRFREEVGIMGIFFQVDFFRNWIILSGLKIWSIQEFWRGENFRIEKVFKFRFDATFFLIHTTRI